MHRIYTQQCVMDSQSLYYYVTMSLTWKKFINNSFHPPEVLQTLSHHSHYKQNKNLNDQVEWSMNLQCTSQSFFWEEMLKDISRVQEDPRSCYNSLQEEAYCDLGPGQILQRVWRRVAVLAWHPWEPQPPLSTPHWGQRAQTGHTQREGTCWGGKKKITSLIRHNRQNREGKNMKLWHDLKSMLLEIPMLWMLTLQQYIFHLPVDLEIQLVKSTACLGKKCFKFLSHDKKQTL